MKESPFIAVLKRELDRMVSRRIYFASCIVLPLFSIFFMATIFGNGQMENLPVGVVDGDNTATSREIIRMTEAVPLSASLGIMPMKRRPGRCAAEKYLWIPQYSVWF